MIVELISFGFKNNNPPIANYLIDVRFLNNPFYVDELRELTGLDSKVIDFFEKDGPHWIAIGGGHYGAGFEDRWGDPKKFEDDFKFSFIIKPEVSKGVGIAEEN